MVGPSETPAYNNNPNERILHNKPVKFSLWRWPQYDLNDRDASGLYHRQKARIIVKLSLGAIENIEILCGIIWWKNHRNRLAEQHRNILQEGGVLRWQFKVDDEGGPVNQGPNLSGQEYDEKLLPLPSDQEDVLQYPWELFQPGSKGTGGAPLEQVGGGSSWAGLEIPILEKCISGIA